MGNINKRAFSDSILYQAIFVMSGPSKSQAKNGVVDDKEQFILADAIKLC